MLGGQLKNGSLLDDMVGFRVDLCGSGLELVMGCCEDINEFSVSI